MKKRNIVWLCGSVPLLCSLAIAESPRGEGGRGHGGRMFIEADSNSDGSLSKEEFLSFHSQKAEQRFSKMDQNGDGSVTKEEAKSARQEMRKKMREHRREWRERTGE